MCGFHCSREILQVQVVSFRMLGTKVLILGICMLADVAYQKWKIVTRHPNHSQDLSNCSGALAVSKCE